METVGDAEGARDGLGLSRRRMNPPADARCCLSDGASAPWEPVMPNLIHDLPYADVRDAIARLLDNLVNIKDDTGEFLLRLEDGRVIDTKGWNDWEWTHGIGLYGIYKLYEQTNDQAALDIMLNWFRDRFAAYKIATLSGGTFRQGHVVDGDALGDGLALGDCTLLLEQTAPAAEA